MSVDSCPHSISEASDTPRCHLKVEVYGGVGSRARPAVTSNDIDYKAARQELTDRGTFWTFLITGNRWWKPLTDQVFKIPRNTFAVRRPSPRASSPLGSSGCRILDKRSAMGREGCSRERAQPPPHTEGAGSALHGEVGKTSEKAASALWRKRTFSKDKFYFSAPACLF